MATTKKRLVDGIAGSTGIGQAPTKAVIQEFFTEIISELINGSRLELRDFGVFATKTTPARTAPSIYERARI